MRLARGAFARALHSSPNRGSYWGDIAASLYLESQLRRAHSRLNPNLAPHLVSLAERELRGTPKAFQMQSDYVIISACSSWLLSVMGHSFKLL